MSDRPSALGVAETQVAAARDDPAARLALMAHVFRGPTGHAPQHLPFRRAALSFMRWQARRGVLNALDASPPGSVWWRAVNERLLRDGCETVALLTRYPLAFDVESYIADEQRLGQLLDYAVLAPRLQALSEWSADELAEPRVLELVRDGNPIYGWPYQERHVWRTRRMPFAGRVLGRVTRPSNQASASRA